MFINMYKIKITGKDIKRFIKKLHQSGIYINEIELFEKSAYLKLDKNNYEKLLKIKTIYEIKLIRLYGLIKIVDIIKRYKVLIICLCIGMLYFLVISNTIFKIDVIHSKKDIRNLIYNDLKFYGIEKYKIFKSYDNKEQIEKNILERHKDKIEWLEIKRIGIKYEVRVEERIIKKPLQKKTPRNIVAKKDGIIYKIDAYKGEVNKKIGDYVKKGDVIISGLIMKKDEIKNKVSASGNVYAEVWYKTNVTFPYYYSEINYLGNKRNVIKLNVIDKEYYLFPIKKFNTFKNKKYFSIYNCLLPINLYFGEEEQTIEIEKVYSVEEAVEEAKKISLNKMKLMLKNDEKILKEKVLEINEQENYVNLVIFYKVYENISKEEEISDEYIKMIETKN